MARILLRKELWQMTDREYIDWKREGLTEEQKTRWRETTPRAVLIKDRVTEQWREEHVEIIHKALSDGEPVPENVLAEYPLLLESIGLSSEAPAAFECAAITDDAGNLFNNDGRGKYSCRIPGGTTGIGTTPLEALRDARRNQRQGVKKNLREALFCCIGFISGEHSDTEIDKEEVLEMAREALHQVDGELL